MKRAAYRQRLAERIYMGCKFAGVDVVVLCQPTNRILVYGLLGQVAVGGAVDFGAIAGGENGGFCRAPEVWRMLVQRAQRGLELLERKRHLLAWGRWHSVVADSER